MSAADVYSDQVANIQEKIKQLQADRIESYDDLANSITSKYNSNMQDYTEKWRTVAEAPVETLAGLAGGKGIYKGAKKVYDIIQKRRAARARAQQKEDVGEDDEEDVEREGLDEGDLDPDPEEVEGELPQGRKMFMDEGDVDENQTFYNGDDQVYFRGPEATRDEYYNEDGTLKDPTNVPEGHVSNDQQNDEDDQEDVEPSGEDLSNPLREDQPAGLEDDDLDADAGQVEGDLPQRLPDLDDVDPTERLNVDDTQIADAPEVEGDLPGSAEAIGPDFPPPRPPDEAPDFPPPEPPTGLQGEDEGGFDAGADDTGQGILDDLRANLEANPVRSSTTLPQDDVADRNTNIFDPDDEFGDDPSFGLPNTDVSTNAYSRSIGQQGDVRDVTREDFPQDRPPEIPTEGGAEVDFADESDTLGQGDLFFQPTSGRPVYSEIGRGGRLVQDEPGAEGLARDPTTGLTQPEAESLFRPPSPEPPQQAESEPARPELEDLESGQAAGPDELPANNPYSNVRTGGTEPSSNNMPSNDSSPGGEGGGGDGLVGGEQDLVEQGIKEGAEGGESLLSRAGTSIFNNLAQRGQSIRQGFNSVKNFFSRSGAGSEAGEAAGEAAGDAAAGGVEAGLGTADAVLGAVPVVGEIALAVSGIVAIGEGIYHLFHHPKPPTAPSAAPLAAPSTMTAKYSLALPSADNSVDKAGSVGTF